MPVSSSLQIQWSLLFFLLLFLCKTILAQSVDQQFQSAERPSSSIAGSSAMGKEKKQLLLDPTNLDLFFFRAAVSALFKAKAASILRSLPDIERIVFRQCESDAGGRLNQLAKCLVSLFNVRDFSATKELGRTNGGKSAEILAEKTALAAEEMPNWAWLFSRHLQAKEPKKEEPVKESSKQAEKKPTKILEENGQQSPGNNKVINQKFKETEDKKKATNQSISINKSPSTVLEAKSEEVKSHPMNDNNNPLEKNFALFKTLIEGKAKSRKRNWQDHQARNRMGEEYRKRRMSLRRRKRNIGSKVNSSSFGQWEPKELEKYPHVKKLLRIERFYRLVERCNDYIQREDQKRSSFLQSANLPVRLSTRAVQRSPLLGVAESQLKDTVHFDKLSILSPKLLSIFPEEAKAKANGTARRSEHLLSPTFLSFHEQGDFSLPYLLNLVFSNNNGKKETLPWLDLLLEISGAAATLDKLLATLEPGMQEVEHKIHPAILRLEELDARLRRLWNSVERQKREQMDENGYTFIDGQQSRQLLGEATVAGDDDLEHMDELELDALLEQDIRAIARMGDERWPTKGEAQNKGERRKKRQLPTQPYGQVRMLDPFFFISQFNDSAILRRVAISPKAFSAEILSADYGRFDLLSPEAFVPSILSPRAAIAFILSPVAFTSRILSPQAIVAEVLNPRAFYARILSPRAFTAFVLSPRMLTTEILSPKAFEIRVLHPSVLAFNVLSPTMVGLRIAAPYTNSMMVLSPSILNPGFLSTGHDNVEVLSPKILSD